MARLKQLHVGACALAAVSCFCWSVGIASAAPNEKDERRQKLLDKFDADGDGKIGPAEAAKIRKANAEKRAESRGPREGGEGRGFEGRGPRERGEGRRPDGPPRLKGFHAVITVGEREMVFENPGEAMAALHRMMGGPGRGRGGPGFDGPGFEGRGPQGGPRDGEGKGRGPGGPGFEGRGPQGPRDGGEGAGRGRGGPPDGERGKRDRN